MRQCEGVQRLEGDRPVVPESSAAHDGGRSGLSKWVDLLQRRPEVERGLGVAAALGEHRAEPPEVEQSSGCGRQERSWSRVRRRCRGLPEKTTVATEAKRHTKALNLFLIA